MKDKDYMKMVIELAKNGMGFVSPNPLVGAIIVKNGKIISKGYHKRYGHVHAEVDAINKASESLKGASLYVNLEPCSHYGSQPPCSKRIIEEGISKVIIGCQDPNPLVSGKGIKELKDNNVEVVSGVLEEECLELNKIFFHYITHKRPYVALKYAMSLDGKIACYTGDSKWISSEVSRKHSHGLRHRYKAIMAGIGTVLSDDPMLNSRIENSQDPIRIICDSKLRTPLDSKIVKSAKDIKTIIATTVKDTNSYKAYIDKSCEILPIREKNKKLDLNDLMDKLGQLKIDSLLVEGGSSLNGSLLEEKLINKVYAYIGPKLIGGSKAKNPIGGLGMATIEEALTLKNMKITNLACDFLIEGEV